jgi:hypothetical protein
MTGPVAADLAAEAMFAGVPWGGAIGGEADAEGQAGRMGEVFPCTRPPARTRSMAAPGSGVDPPVVGLRRAGAAPLCPLTAKRGAGEVGGHGMSAAVDERLVGRRLVAPVRGGARHDRAGDVIGRDDSGARRAGTDRADVLASTWMTGGPWR